MKEFKVYVVEDGGMDPLVVHGFVGWKGKDDSGKQWGAVLKVPTENFKEFVNQIAKYKKRQ